MRLWRLVSPLATLALSSAYVWLAVQPTVPAPLDQLPDTLVHVGGYLALALLACLAARHLGLPRPLAMGWSYALAHGALLEILQHFYPPREASLGDWLADGAGATLGISLCWLGSRWRP